MPWRRRVSMPRMIWSYAGRPPRLTRCAVHDAGPSMLTPTRTSCSAKNAHQASSISVALVWTWCSTPANGAISRPSRSRPAARGSPPCQTTENRSAAAAQSLTEAATASATTGAIGWSSARWGRSQYSQSRLHSVVGCMMTYEGTAATPRMPVHPRCDTLLPPLTLGERTTSVCAGGETDKQRRSLPAGVGAHHLHGSVALDDLADVPGLDAAPGEERDRPVGVGWRDDGQHADAHVERALHLNELDAPLGLYQLEDGLWPPGRPVDDRVDVLGQHAYQVARDAAAGDMGVRPDVALGQQVEALARVDLGGRDQLLTERTLPAELLGHRVQPHPARAEQHVTDQGVPVGVQPGRAHRDDGVADLDPVPAEHLVGLDDAGADLGHPLGNDLAAGDVVQQEQRFGAARHEVVDDHGDQVDADRVVDVHLLGDDQLGTHPVGRRGEDRVAVLLGVQPEQAGEAADVADHLWAPGAVHLGLEELDRLLAGMDRHAGVGVGHRAPARTATVTSAPELFLAAPGQLSRGRSICALALAHVRHVLPLALAAATALVVRVRRVGPGHRHCTAVTDVGAHPHRRGWRRSVLRRQPTRSRVQVDRLARSPRLCAAPGSEQQVRHNLVFGCSVAATNPASETYPSVSAPMERRMPSMSSPLASSSARVAKSMP